MVTVNLRKTTRIIMNLIVYKRRLKSSVLPNNGRKSSATDSLRPLKYGEALKITAIRLKIKLYAVVALDHFKIDLFRLLVVEHVNLEIISSRLTEFSKLVKISLNIIILKPSK